MCADVVLQGKERPPYSRLWIWIVSYDLPFTASVGQNWPPSCQLQFDGLQICQWAWSRSHECRAPYAGLRDRIRDLQFAIGKAMRLVIFRIIRPPARPAEDLRGPGMINNSAQSLTTCRHFHHLVLLLSLLVTIFSIDDWNLATGD